MNIADDLANAYEEGYQQGLKDAVKHARWKFHPDGSATCSLCGFFQKDVWDLDTWQNFCGVCGARMDGVVK